MENNSEQVQPPVPEKEPFFKMIMEDHMLLMFLGVAIYAIFYLLWGIMELANLQQIPDEIKQQLLN
jgi:hypothetical protein